MKSKQPVAIDVEHWWMKVVDMLQQNWAVIQSEADSEGVVVLFVADDSRVFDRMGFRDAEVAEASLRRNGFDLVNPADLPSFISPPKPPYFWGDHTNGPIYSSGRFWRSE